jgi:hypothetical protein
LAVAALIATLCWLPLWFILDASVATTGFEMESVDAAMLAEATAAGSKTDFLELYGFSDGDPFADQLSLIGKPNGFTLQEEQVRFWFVPADRALASPWGTLIVFDRTANEEFLQAQTARNIAVLLSGASLAAAIAGFALVGIFGRKAKADD